MAEFEEIRVLEVSATGRGEGLHLLKEPVVKPRRALRGASRQEEQALGRMREQALAMEELLAAILPQTDVWLETLCWKASFSQHFRFFGQMLPLLGGTAFFTELSQGDSLLRYVLGSLMFLGSIVGLVSQHTERTLLQGRTASEILPQLVETRALGVRMHRDLRIWRQVGQNIELGSEVIHEAKEVLHRLNTLGPLIGGREWRKLTQRLATRLQGLARAGEAVPPSVETR